ncbi:MAG: hypothetical protein AAF399_03850 [Bacteroidota bacterium]
MAQSVAVQMVPDTQELRIGEVLQVSLRAAHQADVEVLWPNLADTLGKFEILSRSPLQESTVNGQAIKAQQFDLIAFDSGAYQLPAVAVGFRERGDSSLQQALSLPIPIQVYTVVVDTAQAIKPIKEIIAVPITTGEILRWAGGILLILALVVGGYWWWKKRQERPLEAQPKPTYRVPPHETAMRDLARLEADKLWQQGEIKAYYTNLTEIVRQYIEATFEVPALESITDEIVSDLRGLSLEDKLIKHLKDLLQQADLAKFAKFEPTSQDNLQAIEIGREFIRSTKDWVASPPEMQEVLPQILEVDPPISHPSESTSS